MKAFLLAAGFGTRLKPLTDRTPKCLLPVRGKPILQIWLEHLGKAGVTEVLVNTHYLHTQVEDFAGTWKESPRLQLVYEPVLLGSAGTLAQNRNFVGGEPFLVCYSDNLTTFDVSLLMKELLASPGAQGVMALHRTQEPHRCGIAALNPNGWVTQFEEKPREPKSNLANSGMYAFSAAALDSLPTVFPSDIARDFIPKLIPGLKGLEMKVPLLDIGTLASYEAAQSFA
jgi:mannose-1-phosphate guanylyltransferase